MDNIIECWGKTVLTKRNCDIPNWTQYMGLHYKM